LSLEIKLLLKKRCCSPIQVPITLWVMNKNKQLEADCVNLLKAVNLLDKIESYKVERITDSLMDILSNKTTKLSDKFGYMPSDIDQVLKRA